MASDYPSSLHLTSLHPNNPQGFPSTHLLPMHALLSPHEAMINLAVSSKVTLSFRSTLFLSSSSLSSSEHPLSSRSYQEWDIAVRLEKSEVQNPKFKVQSSKFKVQCSKFKVQSSKFKVQSSKFKVQSSKFKVQRFAILLQTTATAFKILIFCLLGSSSR